MLAPDMERAREANVRRLPAHVQQLEWRANVVPGRSCALEKNDQVTEIAAERRTARTSLVQLDAAAGA
jgi:hypothetical protein